jgi:hypothetical protein
VKDTTSQVSIILNKRYSAFEQLHQKIIEQLSSEFTLQLPGKRFLNKDPVFLEERKNLLAAYLTSLFTLPKVQADEVPEVHDFLEIPRLVEVCLFFSPPLLSSLLFSLSLFYLSLLSRHLFSHSFLLFRESK